jgi:hypothetical protein
VVHAGLLADALYMLAPSTRQPYADVILRGFKSIEFGLEQDSGSPDKRAIGSLMTGK